MASTSTGHAKSIISREQPSSSGQVMSFTSGCILNVQGGAKLNLSGKVEINSGSTVDIESGGKLTVASGGGLVGESGSTVNIAGKLQVQSGGEVELESGATMNVEEGGSIKFTTGAYMYEPLSSHTTNTANVEIPCYGVSIIVAATSHSGTSGKAGPKWSIAQPPRQGIRKTIIQVADSTKNVMMRLSTDKSVLGDGGAKYHTLAWKGAANASTVLNSVELVSRSSVKWVLTKVSSGAIAAWTSWYRD